MRLLSLSLVSWRAVACCIFLAAFQPLFAAFPDSDDAVSRLADNPGTKEQAWLSTLPVRLEAAGGMHQDQVLPVLAMRDREPPPDTPPPHDIPPGLTPGTPDYEQWVQQWHREQVADWEAYKARRDAYASRYYNPFPVVDFRWMHALDWHPVTSSFRSYDAALGWAVPWGRLGRQTAEFSGTIWSVAGLWESGSVGSRESSRRGVLGRMRLESIYHLIAIPEYETVEPRLAFPFQRTTSEGIFSSLEFELGHVRSEGLTESMDVAAGMRAGLKWDGGVSCITLGFRFAIEDLDRHGVLKESGIEIVIGKPISPVGAILGWRHQHIRDYTQSAITLGIELRM